MGELGTSAQVLRQAGFEDVLKDYPDIKIVTSISDGWDSAKSLAATQDILLKYPAGTLDAIVNQGPAGVPGSKYAQQIGRTEVKWNGEWFFALGQTCEYGYPSGSGRASKLS
jgi:ribose transport system substrate-binding protein